jgi:hypothetical protein
VNTFAVARIGKSYGTGASRDIAGQKATGTNVRNETETGEARYCLVVHEVVALLRDR